MANRTAEKQEIIAELKAAEISDAIIQEVVEDQGYDSWTVLLFSYESKDPLPYRRLFNFIAEKRMKKGTGPLSHNEIVEMNISKRLSNAVEAITRAYFHPTEAELKAEWLEFPKSFDSQSHNLFYKISKSQLVFDDMVTILTKRGLSITTKEASSYKRERTGTYGGGETVWVVRFSHHADYKDAFGGPM